MIRFSTLAAEAAAPLWFVTPVTLDSVLAQLPAAAQAHARALAFAGKPCQYALVPLDSGLGVLVGNNPEDSFAIGKLVGLLPAGSYNFVNPPEYAEQAALGWLLSAYRFAAYKKREDAPMLVAPSGVDVAKVERLAGAVALGRDLINTPANDMGPEALEAAVRALAGRYGADVSAIRGDDLLTQNFPLIHAVGRAAAQAPRLVECVWGRKDAPKVTLVGKGVTFDTGGLDIKPESAMAIMKKDMGGAATALALADMLMSAGVDIRLRVIIAIVENSISASSFRPGDIYTSRKGLSVEIGNTDAEGRLILADALTYADEGEPELLLDFATLTGAARVALGPDLPPFYTDDEALAAEITQFSMLHHDPVWRMPLWQPYASLLEGKISDLNNISGGPFAGSITAALFLKRFVTTPAWVHFDVYGWNPATKPGRPEGGEIQSARLLYELILRRYGE